MDGLNLSFVDPLDEQLANSAFYALALLIFGKNNIRDINNFKSIFESLISRIDILDQTEPYPLITDKKKGGCALLKLVNGEDEMSQRLFIFFRGLRGIESFPDRGIRTHDAMHDCTHEFAHAFVEILSRIRAKYQDGIDRDGVHVKNSMGGIKEIHGINPTTREPIVTEYGLIYTETMTDIIASMANNQLLTVQNQRSIDAMLKSRQSEWGNPATGYSIFTSITRLTIAAFSNDGFVSYDQLAASGVGIFDHVTTLRDGSRVFTNDFLFGSVFDPMHIERVFDSVMASEGYTWKELCTKLDSMFARCKSNEFSNEQDALRALGPDIRFVMGRLAKFTNLRLGRLGSKISVAQISAINSNFNRIFKDMQDEYGAYFSRGEIDRMVAEGLRDLQGGNTNDDQHTGGSR